MPDWYNLFANLAFCLIPSWKNAFTLIDLLNHSTDIWLRILNTYSEHLFHGIYSLQWRELLFFYFLHPFHLGITCFPFPVLCRKLKINKILGNWSPFSLNQIFTGVLQWAARTRADWNQLTTVCKLGQKENLLLFSFRWKNPWKGHEKLKKESKIELKLTAGGGSVGASRT